MASGGASPPSWRFITRFEHQHLAPVLGAGLAALLLLPSPGFAQPGLGSAAMFAVLAGSTVTNTGATSILGSVGATLGTSSTFKGNIVALASITLTTGAALNGRPLARTGAVTMDTNDVGDATTPTLGSSWGMVKTLYR